MDLLRLVGDLRNLLVHEKVESYGYPAVPVPTIVERLEEIFNRLANPDLAIATFQRKVETLSAQQSLAHVFEMIAKNDYSQFPVYDDNRFLGLLTENGITRRLAHYVSTEISLIDLEEVRVETVLQEEEHRMNHLFVSTDTPTDVVKGLFGEHDLLEAVLITEKGKREEKIMGIATRWDILRLK